ncbi:MAG TPA: hypothetical protein DCX22_01570 [Dehalococcoidia bacterium]|nr:hypothetical protein [Dehalococcoidia bacterium]
MAVLLIITLIVSAFNVAFTGAAQASESIPSTPVSLSPANGATVYTLTPRIQWQASADNETFSIQMAADYRFSKLILEQKDITDPYYDVTGLNRNTAYYWRVSAQNSAGISSAWSSMSYFRTTSSLPPNQPENLTAVVVLPGQIVLNWEDKSDNEIKFKIERKTGSGDYFLVTALRSNVVSYIDTNLISDTTYSYRIRAYGIAGDSAYSNEASATTLPPPLAAPILSEPVSNAIVSTLTLRMQWHESPEMTRYGIQIATDNDFANLIVSETNLTSSYYDVPSDALTWKSLYFWRVRGQSGSGMISDWSQPWYFTTFPESSSAFSCGCARR